MREEQGLAQNMGQAQAAQERMMMVGEVVNLLMEGVNPEDLLAQGVPMDIIQEAIEIVLAEADMMEQQSMQPTTEAGMQMAPGTMR